MRKYRDSLEIVADILTAVNLHSSKTGIMETSNLNFKNVNSYLEIALKAGFLVVTCQKYEISSKGKDFLEKYRELTFNLIEVKSSLEQLKDEKMALESAFLIKTNKKVKEKETPSEKKDKPLLNSTSCGRINPNEFYEELSNLGFTSEASLEIISWIDLIHKKNKFFFSGKKAALIKACLACNGAVILGTPSNVSRHVISLFFKVNNNSIQRSYKAYRQLILEDRPDLVK
jgi:predicted transcriptional regulator